MKVISSGVQGNPENRKKNETGSVFGVFPVIRNRYKTETFFSGLPLTGKKPKPFFSSLPETGKKTKP